MSRSVFRRCPQFFVGTIALATACANAQPDKSPQHSALTSQPTQVATSPPPATSQASKQRIDAKGVAQVWVPPGCFRMGSDPTSQN